VSQDIWEAIPEILRCFDNPTVRVIVLKGAGGEAFLFAVDISQFKTSHSFWGRALITIA
jgi:enoyl-CoA hydratase/carnithine racemase